VDLRRVPERKPDPASDPELEAAIRAEIERDGPMTFARFMDIALYDPARGYYRGAIARPGRAGDFLTAPEASPIFGRTIARFARAVHAAIGAPGTFTIREHGAGTGALAAPLVAELLPGLHEADGAPAAVRYLVAEVEPARVETVRSAVDSATGGMPTVSVEADDGDPIDGLVIANEVLDALPTHRLVQRGSELRDILVGLGPDGELVDVESEPSSPAIAARLAAESIALADGQRAEVCLALDAWIQSAAAGLARGVLLLVDYGHPAAELYDPSRRAAGTLATYQGHRVGDDPYRAVGRQDLTAHVDVSAVERAALAAGLVHLGTTTQAEFLSRLGVGELLVREQTGPDASLARYLETRSALVRMIDPGAMGRFAVMAYGRGLAAEATLPGLA
jgi:SAM-dependent MidA family methyltransferase